MRGAHTTHINFTIEIHINNYFFDILRKMGIFDKIKINSGKIQASLSVIIKIILIIAIIRATYFHLWHILFANFLLLLLLFMPFILRKSQEIEIPREFEIILFVFVLLSFFLGAVRAFLIQAFFGAAMGFVGFTIMLMLYSNNKLKTNFFLIILISFSISVALGLGVEIMKYYLKLFLGYTFSVSDYNHAMRGLSFVAIGAFAAAIIGYIYMKGHKIRLIKFIVNKFKKINPNLFLDHSYSPQEILKLISNGENEKLEFKSTLRINIHTNEIDKRVEHSVLKTIIGFLNSEGGVVLVGVGNSGEITGIERDRFENNDKFSLYFSNIIKERIGKEYLPFINFRLINLKERTILKVECMRSNKPVFLKLPGELEQFYIRTGPSTIELTGSKLVEYIENNFKRKI